MKNIYLLIFLSLIIFGVFAQEKINVVVIGAHPDDCDIDAGGTAILFSKLGHNVLFVSLTNGDAGHHEMGGGALAKRRITEAKEAGKRFGVKYVVLDNHDGELLPTLENRKKVICNRPNDYHPDHRNAAILVQDAAYMVIVPNVVPEVEPLKKNPVFLYSQDNFQKPYPFEPDITVNIDDVFEQKIYALSAHESQFFEWLPWTSGKLEQVPKEKNERLEWLKNWRKSNLNSDMKKSLVKWYGSEKANTTINTEAFEICEYGRHPTDDEIRKLFPMLNK
jgi:LmbE family N-acetylglucosaminyl deacetylase